MSLINQMLLDLERRGFPQSSEAERTEIRAVPARVERQSAWLLVGVLLTALVATGLWVGTRGLHLAPAPTPVAVARVETVPEVRRPAAPEPVQPAAGGGSAADMRNEPPVRASLRSATPVVPASAVVSAPKANPVSSGESRSAPAPAPAAAESGRASIQKIARPARGDAVEGEKFAAAGSVSEAPPVAPLAEREPVRTAHDSAIDKKVRQLSSQQQAENEFRKAVVMMQQGRIGEAIDGLNTALQLDPGQQSARQTLAALLVEAKRVPEAERVLQEGVELSPDNPRLAMTLARIQVERGALDAALETLERGSQRAANDPDYQGFMGTVLQRLSRHQDAIDHYLAAIRLAPQPGVWLVGIGISLQAENRVADAREAFERAKATGGLSPELLAFADQRLRQLQSAR